ncbi:geranylgeranyl pyrophosphate synthetase [Colletotrichum fioriniae PJ7]|uniref:Geranylgeranyl pyrophosphate synthetase n=1 Tax=Colletotrichum fioriniae PJ7 TaxID=1445577 RepID=A0A010RC55_9PEZI|nr:geranylgeranyl pyrophosphate synthetase [Colletotrichum fioriniae PJ7]
MSSIVAEISRSDLDTPPACDATIERLQYVASYNWIDKDLPTIAVPEGLPPLWAPPLKPPRMTPDSGIRYIDQNAARWPEYPLEPLFRAVCAQNPEFEMSDVDVVTDRNNMRKLLPFVEASASDSFEIKAEIAGKKTLLLTRVEEN